ncbi:methyltransferase domain-containing protein [Paenibacillus sp. NPDC056579]|uniref:methyltransferase domain-containing protein n=1 Tax=Paenibacillus sp. NPDC056579 TaxID=3345871 RepID=UPI0036BCE050
MIPKLEVNDVLREIKKSLKYNEDTDIVLESNFNFPKFYSQNLLQSKNEYDISDFLNYHDEDFVRNVYRGLLKRNPDPQGMDYYLGQLRSGRLNKIEILGRVRYSKEAKKNKIKVKGLTFPFMTNILYRAPIIGYLLKLIISIIKLPRIIKNLNQYEMFVNHRHTEQSKSLNSLVHELDLFVQNTNRTIINNHEKINNIILENVNKSNFELFINEFNQMSNTIKEYQENYIKIEKTIETLQEKLKESSATIINEITSVKTSLELSNQSITESNDRTNEIYSSLGTINKQIKDHKLNIIEMQRRLNFFLEETRKRLPDPLDTVQLKALADNESHFTDAMYVSFEDQFRGTREDIKGRLEVYLPYIDKVRERTGDNTVIDLGCGRGEWLELIEANGFKALGVDMNKVMIDQCIEMGLSAQFCDAIDYLRIQKNNSVSIVTGFHIIEHLPLNKLLTLFDETLRVLKPGGMIIFETPNPESIWVGAFTFRGDPTHINPLVPDTVKFLVEQRGFIYPEILRLHKREEPEYTGQKFVDEIIYKFNMEQDFSIMAYKA